jgi:hypothetical protein
MQASAAGLAVGDEVSLTQEGLDVASVESCLYMGNRAWKIRYATAANALQFQQFNGSAYIANLNLD